MRYVRGLKTALRKAVRMGGNCRSVFSFRRGYFTDCSIFPCYHRALYTLYDVPLCLRHVTRWERQAKQWRTKFGERAAETLLLLVFGAFTLKVGFARLGLKVKRRRQKK